MIEVLGIVKRFGRTVAVDGVTHTLTVLLYVEHKDGWMDTLEVSVASILSLDPD